MKSRSFTLAVLGILLAGAVLRIPSLLRPIWNVDEAVSAVMADTILDGGTIYRDAIDHRGPVTYFVYAGIFKVLGRDNMYAVHAVLMVIAAVVTAMVMALGKALGLERGALFAGGLFAVISALGFPGLDVYALHTEWCLILFTTAGSLGLVWGLKSSRGFLWMAGVGVCFALAFWSKQPGAMDLLGVGFFLLWLVWRRSSETPIKSFAGAVRIVAAISVGFLLVGGAFVSYFLLRDAGREFLFCFWTYNRDYYVAAMPFWKRRREMEVGLTYAGQPLGLGILALAGVFLSLTVARRPLDRSALQVYLIFWGVFSLVGSLLSGRWFGHYFIQVLPAWCLLAGVVWREAFGAEGDAAPANLRRVASAIFAGCILLPGIIPIQRNFRNAVRAGLAHHEDHYWLIATWLRDHSSPDDSIFVWGFDPEIYTLSQRRAASRYSFCTMPVGMIPGVNTRADINTERWIVPGAMETLVAELERNKPLFIIDTAPANISFFGKYPISHFKGLSQLLVKHYELDVKFALSPASRTHVNIYRRVATPAHR